MDQASFFQRRSSVASEADSDYQQLKEEFDKKEKEYRSKIHTLKKEVTVAKESLQPKGMDMSLDRSLSSMGINPS